MIRPLREDEVRFDKAALCSGKNSTTYRVFARWKQFVGDALQSTTEADARADALVALNWAVSAAWDALRDLEQPPPKVCGCGASYSPEEWRRLPLVGRQEADGHALTLRNCECGSTLGVEEE